MKELNPEDKKVFRQAQGWANAGEMQASFIVIEALLKKHPSNFKLLLCFLELLEEQAPLKAHTLLGDFISGSEKWQEFFFSLSDVEKACLFERQAILALKLKDEVTALEALKTSASLGRDSLTLWGTLSYLYALSKETTLSVKALCRALELYKEPSLFEESFFFLDKNRCQKNITEELFLNICLGLFPQLSNKDSQKLLQLIRVNFPNRKWTLELQDIVAQEIQKMPIELSGERYACSDKKNW